MILCVSYEVICPSHMIMQLMTKMFYIGASITPAWSPDCTHVLVDQFMPVKEDLVDIFLAKKPLVLNDWIEVKFILFYF